jgi:hypothetical protein
MCCEVWPHNIEERYFTSTARIFVVNESEKHRLMKGETTAILYL